VVRQPDDLQGDQMEGQVPYGTGTDAGMAILLGRLVSARFRPIPTLEPEPHSSSVSIRTCSHPWSSASLGTTGQAKAALALLRKAMMARGGRPIRRGARPH
jgi:hypothetical protein